MNVDASQAPAGPTHHGRAHDRWVAPGGWRRARNGVAAGVLAGVLVVWAARRDRRRTGDQGHPQ